jgi:hypothetical protein
VRSGFSVFVRLNMCLSSMLALPVTSLPLSFFFFLSSYILEVPF